jgi:hypothetical protein
MSHFKSASSVGTVTWISEDLESGQAPMRLRWSRDCSDQSGPPAAKKKSLEGGFWGGKLADLCFATSRSGSGP